MLQGPNSATKSLGNLWRDLIPEEQWHTFNFGGYFLKELGGGLGIVSLNTIYWFGNNKGVEGCKGKRDPGNMELVSPLSFSLSLSSLFLILFTSFLSVPFLSNLFSISELDSPFQEWLSAQLSLSRSRKLQLHLMGHVPPTTSNYHPECLIKYRELVARFQDTIVGSHFGHANFDGWFAVDSENSGSKKSKISIHSDLVDPEEMIDEGESVVGRRNEEEKSIGLMREGGNGIET